jgi:hypothetical protein
MTQERGINAGIECLTILFDHDRPDTRGRRAGEAAARECADRRAAAGREIFGRSPAWEGFDIADVIAERLALHNTASALQH